MTSRRALHFVLKIGNRKASVDFFKNVLGMEVLRHEEFEEGCKASCNGPYDGRWSKSMIGYGSEDNHFVVELTYNYGIGSYALGNDFQGITIKGKEIAARAAEVEGHIQSAAGITVRDSGGYPFHILSEDKEGDPVVKVTLSVSDIQRSHDYWVTLLGMKCYSRTDTSLLLGYADTQAKLELVKVDGEVDHAKAFGRIAFSCDRSELAELERVMKVKGHKILTPLVSLDTPGKSTVEVVILSDPALEADKSDEWYSKKGKSKDTA
ncbi:GLOD4 [Bugula neritina]|uniref:GLOD4 n=1 Tax=Bugula neritina TaxID=10212 RepID=A0A7J7JY66_BUGNE|nr:GLOD4 [Bugula neritina]